MNARPVGAVRRKGPRWAGDYVGVDGKRRTAYGATKGAASTDRKARIDRENDGGPATDARVKFATYVETVIAEWFADDEITFSTTTSYAGLLRNRVVPSLGKLPLAEIRPQHLRELYRTLRPQLTTSTMRSIHAALRKLFKAAVRDSLLTRSPMESVERPRQIAAPQPVKHWEGDEYARVIAALQADDQRALWMFIAGTGVRISESIGLRWDDVDLDGGLATIANIRHRVGGTIQEGLPKNHAIRPLELPPIIVAELRRHLLATKEARLALGPGWTDSGYVFTTPIGTPLDDSNTRKAFDRVLARAGVEKIKGKGPHALRHSLATEGFARGHDTATIGSMLGHKNKATTETVYIHATQQRRREAAADIAGSIFG